MGSTKETEIHIFHSIFLSSVSFTCSLATSSRALGKALCSRCLILSDSVSSVSSWYTGTASCTRIAPPSTSSYKLPRKLEMSLKIIKYLCNTHTLHHKLCNMYQPTNQLTNQVYGDFHKPLQTVCGKRSEWLEGIL